jgi:hypothetical protein
VAETPAQHATCLETTTVADLPNRTYVCGPDCPRPAGPDPDRDRRVDAYRDRERRRAARALDRYMEVIFEVTDPQGVPTSTESALTVMTASERFVEQVGDYVLARLGHTELNVQQKSAYGVSGVAPAMKGKWQLWMHECGHVEMWEEGTAPADGGCDGCESGSNNASDWRPLYTDNTPKSHYGVGGRGAPR